MNILGVLHPLKKKKQVTTSDEVSEVLPVSHPPCITQRCVFSWIHQHPTIHQQIDYQGMTWTIGPLSPQGVQLSKPVKTHWFIIRFIITPWFRGHKVCHISHISRLSIPTYPYYAHLIPIFVGLSLHQRVPSPTNSPSIPPLSASAWTSAPEIAYGQVTSENSSENYGL